jgi:hypothetical protein
MDVGIEPVRLTEVRYKEDSFVQFPISEGSEKVNWFETNTKDFSLRKWLISKVPLREVVWRYK